MKLLSRPYGFPNNPFKPADKLLTGAEAPRLQVGSSEL